MSGSSVILGFPDERLTAVTQKAWIQAGGEAQGRLKESEAGIGLQAALQQLQPAVPMPREPWYCQAFRNFDADNHGYITYNDFWQIVKQYHDHHAERNARKYREQLEYAAAQSSGLISAMLSDSVSASLATVTKARGDGWEFVSDVVYPSHKHADVRQIFQDYEFGKEYLGEGSFGKVSVAVQKKTGQRRVCKSIDITCPAQWELIKQEIELMKTLNHPNIIRLHETYHGGYRIYLILELCEGPPLYQKVVNTKAPIMEEQVAEWMKQILSATAFCHSMKIVHRDIKPENILFVNTSEDSPIKVIDFGLSSTLAKIRRTQKEISVSRRGVAGVVARILPKVQGKQLVSDKVKRVRVQMQCAGTPHYMAPEMIQGSYDEKCDMFSVGVILYQLLCGRHPFFIPGQDNQQTVTNKILKDNPPTEGEEWKAVSPEGIQLVKWMLQKDPRKRCSAQEALDHLWFRVMSKPRDGFSSQLTPSVFEGLKSWQTQNKLKQAILHLMARELSESDISDLRKKFEALDRKGSGTISLEELRYSVRGYPILDADLERIFKSLDTSGSNRIHYTEFISALLAKRMKFEERQLRAVFNKFDPYGEGLISLTNLKVALKGTKYGTLSDVDLEKIFRQIDKNNDGYIDFLEFSDLVLN